MNFRFHHSLASRAAVSVVQSLWYHENIEYCLKGTIHFVSSDGTDDRSENTAAPTRLELDDHNNALQKKVAHSVSKLFIPESLKRYLLEFVQFIGENLMDWISYHHLAPLSLKERFGNDRFETRFFDIATLIVNTDVVDMYGNSNFNTAIYADPRKVLRWNPDGEIDLEQTGEALVRNESDPIKRFRLACAYCREDEMLRLWPSVQGHFSSPDAWDSNIVYETGSLFWWRYFHRFWPKPISAYLLHLEEAQTIPGQRLLNRELYCSCYTGFGLSCSPLTLYLLKKNSLLHPSIAVENLTYTLSDARFREVIFRMPESCHAQILRDSPVDFFEQLLCCRHQSFFIDTVESNWDLFDTRVFHQTLLRVASYVKRYADSDIYRRIFHWCWTERPAHLRDLELVLYDMNINAGHTFRCFVELVFPLRSAAEDRLKRVLDGGRHVLDLVTAERKRHALADLVRACFPAEEWDGNLELLDGHFAWNRDAAARFRVSR